MSLTEKNIRNIFIYSLPRFVGYGLNLVSLPILTRLLKPEDFGIVILSLAFPTIAVNVFTFGLPSSVQRYYFEYRTNAAKLSGLMSSLQFFLYVCLIVSSIAVFLGRAYISRLVFGDDTYGGAVFISYVAAYLSQIINFYLIVYQNMERAIVFSTFTVIQSISTILMSLLFVWYYNMSYMGMIYGSLASAILICVVLFFHFNAGFRFSFSDKILIENIKYGLQLLPKSFTGFINRYFDKYMLNNILSLSAVGIYNIGQSVGNVVFVLMSTVWSSFQPVYYREVFDNGERGAVSVGRMFTTFCYISLIPVLLLVLFAQELIQLIAPASYYAAIDIIIVLAGGMAVQAFGMYAGIQYAYSKKAYWIFPISIVGTLVNVETNILLIPKFGMIGAALSTVVMYCILNGLLTVIGQKLYKIEYEWKTITIFYVIIELVTVSVLYLRHIEFNIIYFYLLKLTFIVLFIFAGIRANLITRQSIIKVQTALFPFSKSRKHDIL